MKDFEIESGVLKKYTGKGGDVVIPDGVSSIGNQAFFGCESLMSVTIPDSVTGIGRYVFFGCRSLMSVAISDSVTSIGDSAFGGCKSLTSVTIPDGVTRISDGAFFECRSLTSVTIPDSVTSIGDSAFRGCENLTSVTIPDSVMSIGNGAFSGCRSLTSVTIPDSVTSIGDSAFGGCENLTGVTIPDSVTSIGGRAFEDCSSLAEVPIPEGVISIGERAFVSCSKLKKIVLPSTLEIIGDGAFAECVALEEITIPENPKFGPGDWFKKQVKEDPQIPQKLLMELNILEPFMDNVAFNRVFNKASVWNRLSYERQADAYLNRHIAKLKKKFKKFIKPNDSDAIAKEMLLKLKVKISAKERNAGRDFLIDYYPYISEQSFIDLYEKMDNSSRMAIIEALKNSNDLRFRELLSEQGNDFPQKDENKNGVIEVDAEKKPSGQCATDYKSGIKGLAFVVTGDMESFGYKEETEFFSKNDYSDLKAFIEERGGFLRTSVTSKTDYLICNNQSEETVKLKKARELGTRIITEKDFLKMAEADEKPIIKHADATDFLITKGCVLKEYTGNSTEITIPSEVKYIGDGVFFCGWGGRNAGRSLEKVHIPSSVVEIKPRAFSGCGHLKEVRFSEGIQIIGDDAFFGCDSLEEISLPSTIREIGKAAFFNMSNNCLKRIELYDTVEKIARNSFEGLSPSQELEISIKCIAHNVESQRQIILAFGLDNVAYAFLHDKLISSGYIMDQIQKRLKTKNNRMHLMRVAINLNDMPAIIKLLSLDIKRSRKENEEIIAYAKEHNNTEVIAYLLNEDNLKSS